MSQSAVIDFIHELRFGSLPVDVRAMAQRCLLDLIGVAAAGSRTRLSAVVRTHAARHFGAGAAPARLMFDPRTASPAGAALANAMSIDSVDAHDGHPTTKGHAGCGVLPALLAFVDAEHDVAGEQFLAALVMGYEVAIRAGIALHRTTSDYHTSGAWVALAAAALGARALELDAGRTRHALGIAEYHGPRSQMMRCIDHPTMLKDGSGWGAMAGVSAAYLAADGFTGAPAITVDNADVADLWEDLGRRWRVLEQYFKPYPVCRWAQPATEAALSLTREHGFAADDIESIEVFSFHEATRLAAREPATTEEAQYSLPFPVAAALARGCLGYDEISDEALRAADILRLSRSIKLTEEPRYNAVFPAERWAHATITLRDGRRFESPPTPARGNADNALADDVVSATFHRLATPVMGAERAAAVESATAALAGTSSVRDFADAVFAAALDDATGESSRGAALGEPGAASEFAHREGKDPVRNAGPEWTDSGASP